MTLKVVIDTNIWIRILLKGRITLPILVAFNENKFQLVISQPLFDEFHEVWNRPQLRKYIDINQAIQLEKQLINRSVWIEVKTIPPQCRDIKDLPVLATAIDGKANIIVSFDYPLFLLRVAFPEGVLFAFCLLPSAFCLPPSTFCLLL